MSKKINKKLAKLIYKIKTEQIVCTSFNAFNNHHYKRSLFDNKYDYDEMVIRYLIQWVNKDLLVVNNQFVSGYLHGKYYTICFNLE